MARQCTQPKRPRNAACYKDNAMLVEAQEAGQILDEEQLAFFADPRVPDGQAVYTIIPNNDAFQTEDLDTYDSNCDDVSNAKAVLMDNISNYGSDVISEVVQIVLWYLDSGCSKHMTGKSSQLMNFVSKFLGTFRSGNDHIARIMGYGDYQLGNVTILRVCYVKELGHNLFSVDPRVPDGQAVYTIIPNNDAFQTEDLDTYDSNCDDVSNAKAVLMANISNYGSDVISEVVQIVLWYLDSGCSKHMTGKSSQLMNFVSKFLGTFRSGNDHIARIMGYGDYQLGNVTILRVCYVKELGHNLFSVGQFCKADLEVAF
nr:integrase, catalytic region, zinc finger, CCHC-type, peptidase aspartic, catalytic [Tanacetum cinerariifolium]